MKWAFYVLLGASVAPAQNALWLDLSGEWRSLRGDDPRYALSDFDDSSWSRIQLPQGSRAWPRTVTWRRRQVALPPGTGRSELAITVGTVADVFEIYVNGQLIGRSGSFRSYENLRLPRPLTFQIPKEVLTDGSQTLVIALRIKAELSAPAIWRLADHGPWVLSSRNAAPIHAGRAQMTEAFKAHSLVLPLAAAIFLCGGFSFIVWLGDRSRQEVLWFALYAMAKCFGMLDTFSKIVDPAATPWNAEGFHWQLIVSERI